MADPTPAPGKPAPAVAPPTAAPPAAAVASTPTGATKATPASPAIPVGINEAALDSPSFRAVTVHFSDQVDGIERWLDGYVRATSKVAADMLALEETINNHLSKMMPPAAAAADAVIDPDYTLLALRRAADGSRQWWTQILSCARRMDAVSVEPIRAFIGGELRAFKEARRALEQAQKTYDTTLARYVGQYKTKEPSALREDAFAVYETRKTYLRASVDFCLVAPQLRFGLDKLLVRVCADVCREVKRSADGVAASAARWGAEVERVRGWSKEMEASEAAFKRELHMASRDVVESTLASWKPSRELEDYSASTVPFLGSRGPMSVQRKGQAAVVSEKQGWLFLRVLSGKPVRTNWVRRWYYCRDGIFGWLVQGPSGVLQGDEVGVLLCSVKPAVQEERRFCFEVKTKSQTFLLQAETQAQLIEWLEVFEVAKTKAIDASMGRDNTSLPGGVDPAFAITTPSIPEFSAKSLEGIAEDGLGPLEKSGTLPVPGPDGGPANRASVDFNASAPRRSITMLGREEGESGREHAARIMQKLDLHRKATFAAGMEATPSSSPSAGGIASLISASHTLLPSYSPTPMVPNASLRQQPSALITTLERQPGSLAPHTLANAPVSTNLTKPAVIASAERGLTASGPLGVSSAVAANYWGSGPWSTMYSLRSEARIEDIDEASALAEIQPRTEISPDPRSTGTSGHRKTVSVDTKPLSDQLRERAFTETFPPRYPLELKAQHATFRLLFPSVPLREKLVLVFNAAWSSTTTDAKENKRLAGNGRIFVTPDNMYFYGHQMGLVVLYTISLDMITEVTGAPGRDCDYIFLHLSQVDMNDTGLARITLKLFLENLPLLHSRLNLLIDDLQAEEPMELSELVSALVNVEQEEYDKKSPSVESWEEVPSRTPVDDGTAFERPMPRNARDLFDHRSSRNSRKPASKLQLPTHPVVYEPEGMGKSVAERHFEISAKACFHVLFGDKSFVFPKIYFERRAKEIAQGPWELQDHGRMKRQFKYKVDYVDMLGRTKPGDVVDYQTVDLFSDHVTYVVTHVKTPWHLPHSQAFKLVSKVVITHVAKSKCKLAIYTRVDWSKAPAFSKNMVQRQALDDAANDAEDLAEIATDQVRRLGPHSRTKRAIQVYGNIGQQKQVVVFTPNEAESTKKPQIKPRTLTDMLVETVRSFMESAISSVMMWSFAVVKKLFSIISAHRIILLFLALSTLYNLVVISRDTSAWWTERNAAKYMNRIGVGPNVMMSKAIYLSDLEEVSQGTAVSLLTPQDSRW